VIALSIALSIAATSLAAAPARAQSLAPDEPVGEPAPRSAALGGWSPQFEFGIGVLTQSHDGKATIPTNSGSRIERDSGDSIISGFTGFALNALSPALVESSWRPRVVVRSSAQIPLSDGLISSRSDQSFETTGPTRPGFLENCPSPVPGSAVPSSTCSIELRTRTTVNALWTAGLGLDFTLPTESRMFHVQPAIEYIGMLAQPEGSFVRRTAGSIPTPPPGGTSARFVEFVKQVGASETYHGVAAALTGSADAHREGPWVWSVHLGGRAAWFLTDREITTRRTDSSGEIIFVTAPAVNDLSEVQWQVMAGFSVRFDPLPE